MYICLWLRRSTAADSAGATAGADGLLAFGNFCDDNSSIDRQSVSLSFFLSLEYGQTSAMIVEDA